MARFVCFGKVRGSPNFHITGFQLLMKLEDIKVKVNLEWPNEECPNYYPIDESRGPSFFSTDKSVPLYPVYFPVKTVIDEQKITRVLYIV